MISEIKNKMILSPCRDFRGGERGYFSFVCTYVTLISIWDAITWCNIHCILINFHYYCFNLKYFNNLPIKLLEILVICCFYSGMPNILNWYDFRSIPLNKCKFKRKKWEIGVVSRSTAMIAGFPRDVWLVHPCSTMGPIVFQWSVNCMETLRNQNKSAPTMMPCVQLISCLHFNVV